MSRPNPARSDGATPPDVCAPDANAPDSPVAAATSWRASLGWLRHRLRRRFAPDLADDLVQETYLRLVRRDPPITAEPPRGLLMAVATNLARDSHRRERVRAAFAAGLLRGDAEPYSHSAADDLVVREAILRLPPQLRDVLLLSKIGGLTNREIAQRYGLSVRAIDKRLQKAVTMFVAHLRD